MLTVKSVLFLMVLSTQLVAHATNKVDLVALLNTTANEQGIDPRVLAAVIKIESDFRVDARSEDGAEGLMQLMPITQREMALSNPYNPSENMTAGSGYFIKQYKRFNFNLDSALWAYNAGPERVKQNVLPAETREYINRFYLYLNALIIAQQQLDGENQHD
jgi:soluble lytic murein transglycosylase-like protein